MPGETEDDVPPALPARPATVAQTPAALYNNVDPQLLANLRAILIAEGVQFNNVPGTAASTPPTPMDGTNLNAQMDSASTTNASSKVHSDIAKIADTEY